MSTTSKNRDDIDRAIERVCEEFESRQQTEAIAVADHLDSLKQMAQDEDMDRYDYLDLLQASLQELVRTARSVCIDLCGECDDSDKMFVDETDDDEIDIDS